MTAATRDNLLGIEDPAPAPWRPGPPSWTARRIEPLLVRLEPKHSSFAQAFRIGLVAVCISLPFQILYSVLAARFGVQVFPTELFEKLNDIPIPILLLLVCFMAPVLESPLIMLLHWGFLGGRRRFVLGFLLASAVLWGAAHIDRGFGVASIVLVFQLFSLQFMAFRRRRGLLLSYLGLVTSHSVHNIGVIFSDFALNVLTAIAKS